MSHAGAEMRIVFSPGRVQLVQVCLVHVRVNLPSRDKHSHCLLRTVSFQTELKTDQSRRWRPQLLCLYPDWPAVSLFSNLQDEAHLHLSLSWRHHNCLWGFCSYRGHHSFSCLFVLAVDQMFACRNPEFFVSGGYSGGRAGPGCEGSRYRGNGSSGSSCLQRVPEQRLECHRHRIQTSTATLPALWYDRRGRCQKAAARAQGTTQDGKVLQ